MERRIKGKLANPGSPRKMDIKTSVYIYSDLVLSDLMAIFQVDLA